MPDLAVWNFNQQARTRAGERLIDMSEEHSHIGVRFFERHEEVEPPVGAELRRAIRGYLEQRYSPLSGEVWLRSSQTGWSPMEGRCWVYGVKGGSGAALRKSVEGDVLAMLARLGKLARE